MSMQEAASVDDEDKLDQLRFLQFYIRVMECGEAGLNENLQGNEEWALYKASPYYPDRFEEWSEKRTAELGFDPKTVFGPFPE